MSYGLDFTFVGLEQPAAALSHSLGPMPSSPDNITTLELQLRLAQKRLDAAQSGLFTSSASMIDRYRRDVERLEKEIARLRAL